ncbi:flavin reductase [Streptomyces sp. NPDC004609]|uniref:flavin reductase n=1 Tax=Streptomyces sp. NPDC004609 TaxID=3364704 RepID=UPI0036C61E13
MNVIDIPGLPSAQKQGLLPSEPVQPRPTAMITTLVPGRWLNVAPHSCHTPISGESPLIAVTAGDQRQGTPEPKDTWPGIERTGEFVVNVTTAETTEHIEAVARGLPARPAAPSL